MLLENRAGAEEEVGACDRAEVRVQKPARIGVGVTLLLVRAFRTLLAGLSLSVGEELQEGLWQMRGLAILARSKRYKLLLLNWLANPLGLKLLEL